MPKELIDRWTVKGLGDLHQNAVKSFDAKSAIQKVGRNCTIAISERRNRNGEVVMRSLFVFHQQMVKPTASFAS